MFDEIRETRPGQVEINGGWTFKSRTEAEAYITMRDEWYVMQKRTDSLPGAMTAEQYQGACATYHVPYHTDPELINMAYGLRYGDYSPQPGGYTVAQWAEMLLAGKRLAAIKAERVAKPKPVHQRTYPQGRKLDCGCIVYEPNEVMSASLGTSCPDCYDRMS